MEPDKEWLKIALEITGSFETNGDPWSDITGNFDSEGISCGVLQWNIGQGSLQPLVKAVGEPVVLQYMPVYGTQLWQACNQPISSGLAIVKGWQVNNTIKKEVVAELRSFMGSDPMKAQQIKAAEAVGQQAWSLAINWATDTRRSDSPTLHEFCWFFDLVTQNGGLKGLDYSDVQSFIDQHRPDQTDNAICDWLKSAPNVAAGWRDARKNAADWCDTIGMDTIGLFVLSYLRAQKSKPDWKYDMMNHKGTLAIKRGNVHGELMDFNTRFQT